MNNKTKLGRVKKFLADNHIQYIEKKEHEWGRSDLFLPKFKINIKCQGEDDKEFYMRYREDRFPIFVRDEDTPDFVLEKVQNTIIKVMKMQQEKYMEEIQKKQ